METSGLFGTLDYARFILVLDGYCVETFLTSFFPVSSIFEAERKGGALRLLMYHHGFESDVIVMFQTEKLNEL